MGREEMKFRLLPKLHFEELIVSARLKLFRLETELQQLALSRLR
jgi:hypothetical protein